MRKTTAHTQFAGICAGAPWRTCMSTPPRPLPQGHTFQMRPSTSSYPFWPVQRNRTCLPSHLLKCHCTPLARAAPWSPCSQFQLQWPEQPAKHNLARHRQRHTHMFAHILSPSGQKVNQVDKRKWCSDFLALRLQRWHAQTHPCARGDVAAAFSLSCPSLSVASGFG